MHVRLRPGAACAISGRRLSKRQNIWLSQGTLSLPVSRARALVSGASATSAQLPQTSTPSEGVSTVASLEPKATEQVHSFNPIERPCMFSCSGTCLPSPRWHGEPCLQQQRQACWRPEWCGARLHSLPAQGAQPVHSDGVQRMRQADFQASLHE